MSIRIFYVIGTLDIGGAEKHLVRIACALKERGWRPEVFVLNPGGPLTRYLADAGIPILGARCTWCRKLPLGKSLTQQFYTIALLIRAMVTRKPMIAHFFLPGAYLFGGLVALLTGSGPRIMSRRSLNDYQRKHPLYAWIEHRLHRHLDLACGNSRAVCAQLGDEGVPVERTRLIYNGIELLPDFAPGHRDEMRAALGVPANALVMSIVANLIPYKGHADLVDALALVAVDLPHGWRLLCIGRDDGIGNGLRQRAAEAGILDNILWLGSRLDVPEILAASDIGLLVSHEEGFSNAVLEGMAAGLPMVVTDVGGNAEAVINNHTGYVVPARDPQALGAAIRRMVFDPQRSLMGERGRDRIQQYFTLETSVDAYECLYEEVIANQFIK